MFRFYFLIGILIIFQSKLWCQKKIKVLPVPAIGYTPETKTYLGAVSLFTIDLYGDSITRTSNAKFEINYTWNKQVIAESEWNYFFKEEKWFTKGRLHYSKYPDFYFGLGADAPESNKLLFNSNRTIIEISALKNVKGSFFTGPNIKYINYMRVKPNNTELVFPELRNREILGIGYSILKDSRDNILTPTKGLYVNINSGFNFSDNHYSELNFDSRYYKTLLDKLIFAVRFFHESTFGQAPFFDCAILGGDKYVRGYPYGRYRDQNLTSIQTEFRFPVVWRFGLATFGGFSGLYNNSFKSENIKSNYGLGIRFLVDQHDKTNLRLDYAIGEDNNSGFYISFGESF